MKLITTLAATAAALLLFPGSGRAATYNESVNGQLSSNYMAPTVFAVTPGKNTIAGNIGGMAAIYDYVTFTVPAGYFLSSLTLDSFTTNGNGAGVSFFAIAPGIQFPDRPGREHRRRPAGLELLQLDLYRSGSSTRHRQGRLGGDGFRLSAARRHLHLLDPGLFRDHHLSILFQPRAAFGAEGEVDREK